VNRPKRYGLNHLTLPQPEIFEMMSEVIKKSC